MASKYKAYTELLIQFVNEKDQSKKEEIRFNLYLVAAGFYPFYRIKCSEVEV